MKKILFILSILLILPTVHLNAHSIEQIVSGYEELNKVNSGGLYRVVDKTAGVVVYIMTTGIKGNTPQIYAVPFGLIDTISKKNLLNTPDMN